LAVELFAGTEGVGHGGLAGGGHGVVVGQLLVEDAQQLGFDAVAGSGVGGVEEGLADAVHELDVLQNVEGYLDKGFAEGVVGVGGAAEVGEVLGEQQYVAPVLFEEFAAGLVDVDVLEGLPVHGVEVAEEGVDGHTVAGCGHEAVGVAFQLEAVGVVLAEVVVGVVGEVDGPALVEAFPKEGGILLASDQAYVFDVDVGADAFHVAEVPEGEGVVVAVGEEEGALGVAVARLEDVGGGVVGGETVAAVVVVPVLACHECRYGQEEQGGKPSSGTPRQSQTAQKGAQPAHEHGGPEGDEDAEGVEAEDVGIVALARFVGGVVEVEGEDDTAHEEEGEDGPEGAAVGEEEVESEQAQQQGQEEVGVVGAGVEAGGRPGSGADQKAVDEGYAGDELAVWGRAVALAVVVAAAEVPHQIAEVHIGELVGAVVAQIAHQGGVAAAPVGGIEGVVLVVSPQAGVEGCFFVLVAGEVRLEGSWGGGVSFVDGGAGMGPDGYDKIGREADEEEEEQMEREECEAAGRGLGSLELFAAFQHQQEQ